GLSRGRHTLRMELQSDAWLMGSERELESAFGNLLSNAVRYTPAGGEVILRWEITPEGARFSVQDSGIGIEPQHIPRLTERFYRVDRSRSRETGGTGLGLSIVKHVLTRHQGRLEIQSEVGKGSTFSACFPASRVIARKDLPAALSPR
ncbi:MAG: ATP-binding protein, partial [Burkholderiales bacterium]